MDRASERLLRDFLAERRPDDGLLGEEEAGLQPGTTGLTWVLDPIDGTVNYLYRIPVYAVSVAVVTGDPRVPGAWSPVAGCVHHVVTGESWTAGVGRGARQDGVALRLPAPAVDRGRRGGPLAGAGRHRVRLPAGAPGAPGAGVRRDRAAHPRPAADRQRRRSTCAWWPRGSWISTTSAGSTSGTSRPRRSCVDRGRGRRRAGWRAGRWASGR